MCNELRVFDDLEVDRLPDLLVDLLVSYKRELGRDRIPVRLEDEVAVLELVKVLNGVRSLREPQGTLREPGGAEG